MRLTGLLLTGAAISAIAVGQPAAAQQALPFAVAQQDDNKGKNREQKREQRQEQKREQRNERRSQERDQKQQRQDLRQQQGGQDLKARDRREQRQDLRQEQRKQDKYLKREQQDQRQKLRQEQKQREQDQQRSRREEQQKRQDEQRQQQQKRQEEQRQQQQKREEEKRQRDQQRRDDRQGRDERDRNNRDRQDNRQDNRQGQNRDDRRDREDRAKRLDDIRGERRERREGNRRIIEEGSRTIVYDGNRRFIRRDESDRFRRVGRDVNVERIGNETRTVVVGPGGRRIVNVTDSHGRLLRRSRYDNGREVVIIDNRPRGGRSADAFFVALPALAIASLAIPRERYIVEAESAPPEYIYDALMAPPVAPLQRAYTLDEIRYSPDVRDRMPRIDLDTITFDLGSWEVTPSQYDRLAPIAEGIKRAISRNPNEVFLIEGHTDATGNDEDNLSLSDRRAETVAVILTDHFQVPPENLATQGYGSQQLKVQTDAAERVNRRVTVRRITPLLQQGQLQ